MIVNRDPTPQDRNADLLISCDITQLPSIFKSAGGYNEVSCPALASARGVTHIIVPVVWLACTVFERTSMTRDTKVWRCGEVRAQV